MGLLPGARGMTMSEFLSICSSEIVRSLFTWIPILVGSVMLLGIVDAICILVILTLTRNLERSHDGVTG
jgi:hypothetical protein